VVVLTKIDKLKPRQIPERVTTLAGDLGIEEDQLISFSAETGEGRDELAEAIVLLLEQPPWRETAEATDATEPPEATE
jgi:GTP-binding protein